MAASRPLRQGFKKNLNRKEKHILQRDSTEPPKAQMGFILLFLFFFINSVNPNPHSYCRGTF